jgi:hypothetical protein
MGIRLPIWTIVFLAFHFSSKAETNGKKPNILICISEDHAVRFLANSEDLGTFINPTPHLSKISQVGELHPLAYCTNAGPNYTAFSLLTGKSKSTKIGRF